MTQTSYSVTQITQYIKERLESGEPIPPATTDPGAPGGQGFALRDQLSERRPSDRGHAEKKREAGRPLTIKA